MYEFFKWALGPEGWKYYPVEMFDDLDPNDWDVARDENGVFWSKADLMYPEEEDYGSIDFIDAMID